MRVLIKAKDTGGVRLTVIHSERWVRGRKFRVRTHHVRPVKLLTYSKNTDNVK